MLVHDHVVRDDKNFKAVKENLLALEHFRNSYTHYYDKELDEVVFMLLAKAALNFNDFLEKYFNRELTQRDNLIILPIGFKLPFNPIDYLNKGKKSGNPLVSALLSTIKDLNDEGVTDSIIVGFDVLMSSVRKIDNADIIAGISTEGLAIRKGVRITDNPNAQEVTLSDADFVRMYPLEFNEMAKEVQKRNPSCIKNKRFYEVAKEIKNDASMAAPRYQNPKTKKNPRYFYNDKAVEYIVEHY